MAPHLHLLSLGVPLLLTEAGEQIRFRTRKHFALLIRLAVEGGRKFTRDYLMDLFWPDVPALRARHSLAQALTVVKEKVGREHLVVQRTSIALVPGVVDADVRRLDSCEAEIRGPFLEGFEVPGAVQFEQWKDEWRAKLMPRIRDCLVKQMDAGRRTGDFATVERHAQVLLELDPLSEDGVRGFIEARAWVGDRTNALKAFGRFEARLAEELGAKPSADLVRIADLLRQGRRTAPPPTGAGQVSERCERRFEAETLIGREREFSRLYDAWLEVRRRAPRIVVLVGDPGVGKTTLTNAFVSTCQMEGAAIARAQAYDAERELPFAVLAELIKQLTLQRAIGGTDPEALSELTRVSPEIFSAFPGVPKPVEWAAEVIPLRLADAFLKAVEAGTEESPLVLVVDDIHAADNASAAILHIIARKLPHTRLLLILTARSNELRTAAAPSALAADASVEAMRTLELEPLPAAAAEQLVAALVLKADGRIGDVPVPRILQAGNGNPLALELLTKEWLAHGSGSLLSDLEALNTQPVANIGIPRAIGAVCERQIRRLDPPLRAALDLAAVLGRRLADLPLYEVVDLSPAAAGEALSRLKEEGILREVHGELEFRNELIRAQAYYAVAGPARQHLHRSVGELLETESRPTARAIQLEIGWHFLRGSNVAAALPHALLGAEHALQTGAPYEAEQILKAVLSLDRVLGGEGRRLRLLLARALLHQSKADEAFTLLDALPRDLPLSSREYAEVCCMEAAAEYLLHRQGGQRYMEVASRALEAAQAVGDPDLVAVALLEYARSGTEIGDQDRLEKAEREVETLLARSQPAQETPMAHYAQGYCRHSLGDFEAAKRSLGSALELLHHESPNAVMLALAYNALGVCQYHSFEFASAEASFDKALRLVRKLGDDSRESLTASNLCVLHMLRGRFREAIRWGETAVNLGTRALRQPVLPYAYLNLAEVWLILGEPQNARQCTEAARSWNKAEHSWRVNVTLLCECANLALMSGDLLLAMRNIESVESLVAGREQAVPEKGMLQKLKIRHAAHVLGEEKAAALADRTWAEFPRGRTTSFAQVLAAYAWLEHRRLGYQTDATLSELRLLDEPEAVGLRISLESQGFLKPSAASMQARLAMRHPTP